ncbi:MAG: hypothetical protein ABIG43_05380 [Chloroflexota bacterium]
MAQLIYNLVNSQVFWICLVAWILIGVAWASKREALVERLKEIVSKQIIFENDSDMSFYPRALLEKVANGFRNTLRQPFQGIVRIFSEFINKQHRMVYNHELPLRTFAYLFLLLCFCLFAYADSVAITGGLSTMGLISGEIPEFLLNYALAVGVATFLSVIVGFLVLNQTFAQESELMHWSDTEGPWKEMAKVIALVIIFIGLFVSVLLGISRLIALGFIEANNTTEFIVQLGINVLILVNGILSAAIILNEAFRGILVIGIALEWILTGVFYILDYIATILGSVIPFVVDLVWRVTYIVADILLYLIFVPFLGIINVLLWPFREIAKMSKPKPK